MAYQITFTASISLVQTGGGIAAETPNGSVLTVTGIAAVPGGNSPTSGNLATGCTNAGTAMNTLLQANLTQIQNFASGGN